jgi:hypothetical protein
MELFSSQSAIDFPAGLTDKYRPSALAEMPDFARIVKDSKNNVRAALQALETALLLA